MKKAFLIAFAVLVSAAALISCAKTPANSDNVGYVDPYGNYYNNQYGSGYQPLPYVFGAVASVTDKRNYRDFLRGDFCTHYAFFNYTCKLVDNPPVVVLSLQSLEMKAQNGIIFGHLTINVMPDLGVSVNGNPVPKKELPMRFVYGGNVNVLEGQAQDYFTEGNGTPRPIRVRLTGLNKTTRQVTVEILYDGRPMLLGYLNR